MHLALATLPQVGRVTWIGVAPGRRTPLLEPDEVRAEVGTGLLGDHHATSGRSRRQVTLVQAEHVDALAGLVGRPVHPRHLRRNLAIAGVNLLALKDRTFRVGEAVLEWTGPCHPCTRMEEALGPGGLNAMRGHGGITAIVLEPGVIRIGDAVRAEDDAT